MEKKNSHLTSAEFNSILPADTAKIYEVVGLSNRTSTRLMTAKHGEIDFSTLSPARAAQLVSQKFPYLKLIEPKAEKPAAAKIPAEKTPATETK